MRGPAAGIINDPMPRPSRSGDLSQPIQFGGQSSSCGEHLRRTPIASCQICADFALDRTFERPRFTMSKSNLYAPDAAQVDRQSFEDRLTGIKDVREGHDGTVVVASSL